jgi:hypothetical protein
MRGRILDQVVAEHSVLFLGSGFSLEATNRLKKNPPTGNGLKKEIAKIAKVNPDDYSLTDLAEYCNENHRKALYDLIIGTFRITALDKAQRDILAAPWRRIYTTNFDDAAEFGRNAAGLNYKSLAFDQPKPRKIIDGTIVHLHGAVRNVAEENVLDQIVLGEQSYVQQHLGLSPWYDQFLYDLRFSTACYFVGYSLADQHIAALLTKNPRSREKTYFIEPDRIPDRVFASRIEKYGEIESIGIDGFAEAVRARQEPSPLADFHSLRSFKLMEGQPDKRAAEKPTVNETRDFLVHGKLSLPRLMASLPKPIYALPREESAVRAASVLSRNRSLVVDARLGNGKTVFQHILYAKLAQDGYRSLVVRDVKEVLPEEIDFLKGQPNVILVFDSYAVAQSLLEPLAQDLPNAKFIVEVRSSLLEVRLFEIESKVPRPFGRVTLNKLDRTDRAEFLELCRNAGVVMPSSLLNNDRLELRDLLLEVFNSESIRTKIRSDLTKVFESPISRKIVTVVFLMQLVQADVDPDFLKLVTRVDPFDVLSLNIEGSEEVLSLAEGGVVLRSSVFAEYAMQEFVPTEVLSDAVHDCAVFCANRKSERRYRTLLTLFVQYSRIRPMYIKRADGVDQLRALYERLRWYDNVKDEPLFWLQFAILELDEGHYSDARKYIEFSYDKANERPGFLTYQIDTQYLRLLTDMATNDNGNFAEDVFDDFVKYISVVGGMLAEDSHRYFAFSVLERVPDAIMRNQDNLSDGEKLALKASLQTVLDVLEHSSADFLAQTGGAMLAARLKSNVAKLSG